MLLALVIVAPLAVVGIGVTLLIVWLRGKSRSMRDRLGAELSVDPALRGPESAVYRGSTGGYPRVAGNGQLVLTGTHLIFRKILGVGIDVRLTDVTGVETAKVFNGAVRAGSIHLVVHTTKGDVGYLVKDLDGWVAAISRAT